MTNISMPEKAQIQSESIKSVTAEKNKIRCQIVDL
jgi:hypothetical protein